MNLNLNPNLTLNPFERGEIKIKSKSLIKKSAPEHS